MFSQIETGFSLMSWGALESCPIKSKGSELWGLMTQSLIGCVLPLRGRSVGIPSQPTAAMCPRWARALLQRRQQLCAVSNQHSQRWADGHPHLGKRMWAKCRRGLLQVTSSQGVSVNNTGCLFLSGTQFLDLCDRKTGFSPKESQHHCPDVL